MPRRRKLLLLLPALQQARDRERRLIKYSRFPPLSLLTIAGLTPEHWDIVVRDEHVEPVLVDDDFDLVGIQAYVSSANRAYELARHYRARGARVVLGGLHPTTLPDEAARHADAICVGPAETVWSRILADVERGALQARYHGACAGSAALVPAPRRDLINDRAYLIRHTMVSSRGCPHSCRFCYKGSFWGDRYYEARPIAALARELATVSDRLVFFLDDNLLSNRAHCRALFPLLRDAGIVWQAAASLEVARDPAYLAEAYAAGCRSLFVGFESLSAENMRRSSKAVNVAADYAEAARRFHDAGIMINGSFVFGLDDDGPDVFERTVDFCVSSGLATATFHILTPFPGTPLFAELAAAGRLLHRNWTLYDTDHAVFQPRHMTPEALEAGHQQAYRRFISAGSILRRSLPLPGPLKRLAYNIGWMRMDALWEALIGLGLMPVARQIFSRVLALPTAPDRADPAAPPAARLAA
jgi:radical SAM superfamily enzyme YgiQ (UPF0313 family)